MTLDPAFHADCPCGPAGLLLLDEIDEGEPRALWMNVSKTLAATSDAGAAPETPPAFASAE